MQSLLGYSALQSGYASMPRGVGSLIAFLGVPYMISHIGPRRVLLIGIAIASGALMMMAHFDLSMTAAPIMTSGLVQGFGVGLLFAPLNTLSYATLNPVHRTEGTIVATMARSLGSSLGISMMQATLTSDTVVAHARIVSRMAAGDPVLMAGLPAIMNPTTASGLVALDGEVTRQAAMMSYDTIFAWMAAGVVLLAPLLLIMRPPPAVLMANPAEAAAAE
jgi:DHA2 family multidrug resistance protein